MIGSNLRIGARLGLAFGVVLLITGLMALTGMWRLGSLKDEAHKLAYEEVERASLTQKWVENIRINWVRTAAALHAASAERVTVLQKEMDGTSKVISELQKQLEPMINDDKGKALFADIGKAREAYRGPRADLLKKKLAGEDVSAAVDATLLPLASAYLKSLDVLIEHMDDQLKAGVVKTEAVAVSGQWILGIGAAISVAVGLLFAVLSTRGCDPQRDRGRRDHRARLRIL